MTMDEALIHIDNAIQEAHNVGNDRLFKKLGPPSEIFWDGVNSNGVWSLDGGVLMMIVDDDRIPQITTNRFYPNSLVMALFRNLKS